MENSNEGELHCKANTKIKLTEDDIPGAKLTKSVEECGCVVLRRWLLCKGAKTSGKLAVLRQRYVMYTSISMSIDSVFLNNNINTRMSVIEPTFQFLI